MNRSLVALASLLLLLTAPGFGATPPPDPSDEPPPRHRGPRPPRPPHDRMIFFSSGGSWLGVSIADISSERAKELNLKEETGVEVKGVLPGSPAEEAGIEKGDVILEFQGNRVDGTMQLTRMVRETPAGRTVTLKTQHDGSTRTLHVKMNERDGEEHERMFRKRIEIPPIEIPEIDMPDIPDLEGIPSSVRLGVSVEELGEQLGQYFGVKNGEGVLVRSVKKGSAADSAGLRAGDVIVKVDGEAVSDSGDLRSALRQHRGRTFPLTVMRDRREQTLSVTLPKAEEPDEEESFEESSYKRLLGDRVRQQVDQARQIAEEARKAAASSWIFREDNNI
jgi:serine protease Do